MRVDMLTVGMFQSNCYIVSCERTKEALIIDPGDEGERIVDYVNQQTLDVRMILATHGHIDHVAGLSTVASAFSTPVAMHEKELVVYKNIQKQAMLFGLDTIETVEIDKLLSGGEKLTFGELTGEVLHTPGHSPGGVAIAFGQEVPPIVFVGDVLFQGSIGRTDLLGASHRQMMETLKNVILALPDETVVYCGHGPETTIGVERRTNPFLLDVVDWNA